MTASQADLDEKAFREAMAAHRDAVWSNRDTWFAALEYARGGGAGFTVFNAGAVELGYPPRSQSRLVPATVKADEP